MSTNSNSRTPEETRDMIWKMIGNKAKFQIYNMFEMYPSGLSLTELAEKLHKSKSTILSHLKFLFELGIIEKEKVPLKSKPNVFEHVYKFVNNYEEIMQDIQYHFDPSKELTKEDLKTIIPPGISLAKMVKSFYETQIEYFETMQKSGFDDDALEAFNNNIFWVKDKEGNRQLLSHSSTSFDFYNETEFFKVREHIFTSKENIIKGEIKKMNIDYDNLEVLDERQKKAGHLSKPLLLITSAIPYGYIIEYLNKQKKKSKQ